MSHYPCAHLPSNFPLRRLIYDPTHGIGNTISLALHATSAVLGGESGGYLDTLLMKVFGFYITACGLTKRYRAKKAKFFIWQDIMDPFGTRQGRYTTCEWMLMGIRDFNKVCYIDGQRIRLERVVHTMWSLISCMVCIIYTEHPTAAMRQQYKEYGEQLQKVWTLCFPIETFCPTTHHFCHHYSELLFEYGSLFPLLNEGAESSNREDFNVWMDHTTQFMENFHTHNCGVVDVIRLQTAAWEILKLGLVKAL